VTPRQASRNRRCFQTSAWTGGASAAVAAATASTVRPSFSACELGRSSPLMLCYPLSRWVSGIAPSVRLTSLSRWVSVRIALVAGFPRATSTLGGLAQRARALVPWPFGLLARAQFLWRTAGITVFWVHAPLFPVPCTPPLLPLLARDVSRRVVRRRTARSHAMRCCPVERGRGQE
jgi:hypothetical protein